MSTNPVMQAVGRVAAANRKVNVKPGALAEARRELQVARLRRAIQNEVAPTEDGYLPLSEEDRRTLALELLGPGFRVRRG